jgi:hypothetical protein
MVSFDAICCGMPNHASSTIGRPLSRSINIEGLYCPKFLNDATIFSGRDKGIFIESGLVFAAMIIFPFSHEPGGQLVQISGENRRVSTTGNFWEMKITINEIYRYPFRLESHIIAAQQ